MAGRETFVLVFLDHVVKTGAELFEDEAVMLIVVETLLVAHDVILVVGISVAKVLNDGSLGLC